MKKISHKFSYDGLGAIVMLIDRSIFVVQTPPRSDTDKIILCLLTKLKVRLEQMRWFKWDKKTVSFSVEDFLSLRIISEWVALPTYEQTVVNEFLSQGGKKL